MIPLPFTDRTEAGAALAEALQAYAGPDTLVLAIPRGGVPLGRIVADRLGADLDVVLVRKLGAPGNPEYAVGAVDEEGHVHRTPEAWGIVRDPAVLQSIAEDELARIRQRRARYGGGHPPQPVAGRTVVVVDDGLATGATMVAALKAVRRRAPARLVCAVPVASRESLAEVAEHADAVVCLATPLPFHAVGFHYRRFEPVDDEDVVALIHPPAGTVPRGRHR
jgi:putative phosphoribosyl transferase